MKSYFKLPDFISKIYNDEEKMFRIGMGFKFLAISLVCTLSVLLFIYLIIQIDLIFFISHGFPGAQQFKDAFSEFIFTSLSEEILYSFLSGSFIFGAGCYLSGVMIRPIKAIGNYCEEKIHDKKIFYEPDFFSDLKLLTSFSVYFFSKIDEAFIKNKLETVEIPFQFTGIHKPNFEKNFFLNYFLIIAIFGLISSLGIIALNFEIREQIVILAAKFLSNNQSASYILEEQFSIINIGVYCLVGLHLVLYFMLGIHMYSKVATPSFAVFATMRSFLKESPQPHPFDRILLFKK